MRAAGLGEDQQSAASSAGNGPLTATTGPNPPIQINLTFADKPVIARRIVIRNPGAGVRCTRVLMGGSAIGSVCSLKRMLKSWAGHYSCGVQLSPSSTFGKRSIGRPRSPRRCQRYRRAGLDRLCPRITAVSKERGSPPEFRVSIQPSTVVDGLGAARHQAELPACHIPID